MPGEATDPPDGEGTVNFSSAAFLALVEAVHFQLSETLARSGRSWQNCPVPFPPNGYASVVILLLVKLLTLMMEKGL